MSGVFGGGVGRVPNILLGPSFCGMGDLDLHWLRHEIVSLAC